MYISTWVVEYGAVDLYWGLCGRVWRCRSLLGTFWYSIYLYITAGDVAAVYSSVDLYWGRCGRVWRCRTLLWRMLKKLALLISTGDVVVGYGAEDLY